MPWARLAVEQWKPTFLAPFKCRIPNSHCHHGLPVAVEVFGLVRSLKAFRLTGGNKDYLIAGSDSGRYVCPSFVPIVLSLTRDG